MAKPSNGGFLKVQTSSIIPKTAEHSAPDQPSPQSSPHPSAPVETPSDSPAIRDCPPEEPTGDCVKLFEDGPCNPCPVMRSTVLVGPGNQLILIESPVGVDIESVMGDVRKAFYDASKRWATFPPGVRISVLS